MERAEGEIKEGQHDAERGAMEATDARRVFGELVSRVGFGGERIVITRHGKPIAALVSMKDFESLPATAAA